MSSLLTFLMLAILFAAMATLYTEGMWSNAVRLVNVVTAALLATNFFEPLARWMDDMGSSYTYYWDFLALWLLFVVFSLILRVATDQVSRVKVRFLKVADQIGSWVFAVWIGWVMVCFTMMTLHTAPLARNFLFGGFQPEQRMLLGFAPDRQWLGFVQKESLGAFSCSATPEEWEKEKYMFDPNANFMPTYASRRSAIEGNIAKSGTGRVGN
jgi:hypothetical protein